MDQVLPAIFEPSQPRMPREPQASLADLVYRSSLLDEASPLRRGDRKKVFGLSLAVYGTLGGLLLLLGLRSAAAVVAAPRTVTVSLLEESVELPPPPPPPAGAPEARSTPGATAQIPQEPVPTSLPSPSLPTAPASMGGSSSQGASAGVPGGVAGGVAGGTVGGVVGGTPGATLPPRFDAAYLQNPAPEYPSLSRRLGEEGRALLRVLISPEGLPKDIQLQASSGYSRLDQAALQTVRKWRFVPAMRGNETMAAWVLVPIRFNLDA